MCLRLLKKQLQFLIGAAGLAFAAPLQATILYFGGGAGNQAAAGSVDIGPLVSASYNSDTGYTAYQYEVRALLFSAGGQDVVSATPIIASEPIFFEVNSGFDGFSIYAGDVEISTLRERGQPTAGEVRTGFRDAEGSFVVHNLYQLERVANSYSAVFVQDAVSVVTRGPYIDALFAPNFDLNLSDAARIGGFIGFNWQQSVDYLPQPSPFRARDNPDVPLVAPFLDPVPSGYTYFFPGTTSSYPYYYSEEQIVERSIADRTLTFQDNPANPCLYGGKGLPICDGLFAPPGEAMVFSTTLVGLLDNGGSSPLYTFRWGSNFNGTAGGAGQLVPVYETDPESGTGGTFIIEAGLVPEPRLWLLMLAALGLVGCRLRRRQRCSTGSKVRLLLIGNI